MGLSASVQRVFHSWPAHAVITVLLLDQKLSLEYFCYCECILLYSSLSSSHLQFFSAFEIKAQKPLCAVSVL